MDLKFALSTENQKRLAEVERELKPQMKDVIQNDNGVFGLGTILTLGLLNPDVVMDELRKLENGMDTAKFVFQLAMLGAMHLSTQIAKEEAAATN